MRRFRIWGRGWLPGGRFGGGIRVDCGVREGSSRSRAGICNDAPKARAVVEATAGAPVRRLHSAAADMMSVSTGGPRGEVPFAGLRCNVMECVVPAVSSLLTFSLVCIGLVLTPGPNMIYLVSRSICQGRQAGLISLGGVGLGVLVYMLATALGISALLFAVPLAYDVLRSSGAVYLLYLAWQALKPGGRSPFQVRSLPVDSDRKLFVMGFLTSLLNPKIAMLYLSLLPQFIDPARGNVLTQSLALGIVQVVICLCGNALIAVTAGTIASFLGTRPAWMVAQRWVMGTVLAGLGLRMALDSRR
jgi:threonine/homoserine/homoserine lactone efflux protein